MTGVNKTVTKKALHRRKFLRGAGAVVALPLLDSMIPAFAAGPETDFPHRLRLHRQVSASSCKIGLRSGRRDRHSSTASDPEADSKPFRNQTLVLSGHGASRMALFPLG